MFELLLLSVVMSTGYLGPMVLRRFGPHQRVYGLMLMADLVLALVAFVDLSMNGASRVSSTVGAVSIGAAFCLIMLPPIIRDLGRRFMAKGKLRLAKLTAELRELLQPGMGAGNELDVIETILAVREGREQDIVDALKAHKAEAQDPLARRILDERIVMTYLYAQRWELAIEGYERMQGRPEQPGSPQLVVEMVRAYCEQGAMDKAGALLLKVEQSGMVKEPILGPLVARARMVFLAFVGRVTAVEVLVGAEGPLAEMPEAARSYWVGISKLNAGDGSGAREALARAAHLSGEDPRARALAEKQLERAQEPDALGPHSIAPHVAQLADDLAAQVHDEPPFLSEELSSHRLPRLSGVPAREMPVTVFMAGANLLASVVVYLIYGSITDLGALIAAGANIKSATVAGEWWRMVSSTFLHVGVAHLLLNVYGLWVLGRLVEQMQGSARTLAIYAVAGAAGAIASTYIGGTATAVGASGAVVGLMGAAVAELGMYRKHYPTSWARPLFGMLLLLSVAQLAVGFFYPIVDQWGHVGGFAGGALMGVVVSRNGQVLGKIRGFVSWLVVVTTAGILVYTAFSVATSSYTQTLRRYARVERNVGGLVIEVPSAWEQVSPQELYDPGVGGLLDLRRLPAADGLDASIAARLELEQFGGALRAGFDRAQPSSRLHMALAKPWRGSELRVGVEGASGEQHYRLVVFGRLVGDEIWLGTYYHPAALTEFIEPVLVEALASLRAE